MKQKTKDRITFWSLVIVVLAAVSIGTGYWWYGLYAVGVYVGSYQLIKIINSVIDLFKKALWQ